MRWILAFHIIAVICWFAGLFYLPRLFVYHADATDPISNTRFKTMERKLYRAIMIPSAFAVVISGLVLVGFDPDYYLNAHWMLAKLFLVAMLLAYHFSCGYYLRKFQQDKNQYSHKFYRFFNEIPTVLLIAIVCLVVVKPW